MNIVNYEKLLHDHVDSDGTTAVVLQPNMKHLRYCILHINGTFLHVSTTNKYNNRAFPLGYAMKFNIPLHSFGQSLKLK